MASLTLSIALGNYDRTRPLIDGDIAIDGVEPIYMMLSPEEMFFRSFRHQAFDVSELSLGSYVVSLDRGDPAYVGIPVFLSRAFRHTSILIRTDRGIDEPADLAGKRIGIAEYQLTANIWARALLEEDYGVSPSDMTWVRGGMETPGRPEKIPVALPKRLKIEDAPEDRSLNQLLADGEIDGFIGPRTLSCFDQGHPRVARLFADSVAEAKGYYERTGIFPIMHLVGVRRELADRHPWLPIALSKAFSGAKDLAMHRLNDTSAPKITLPFVEEQLVAARDLLGADFWPYGLPKNRRVLDAFLDHHHRQGLSSRRLEADELFHASTGEAYTL
jgi:4,5-dihydroxyphthalate decarboxylase